MASKSKSRRRVFRASCILAALIVAGSSFAWFTSTDEVTNRLSATADYGVAIAEDFTPPENWVPGQAIEKNVGVVNTGNVDAFARMYMEGEMKILNQSSSATAKWDTSEKTFKLGTVGVPSSYFNKVTAESGIGDTTDPSMVALNLTKQDVNATSGLTTYFKMLDKTAVENPQNSTVTENQATNPAGLTKKYSEVQSVQAGGILAYAPDNAQYEYVLNQDTWMNVVTGDSGASTYVNVPKGTRVVVTSSASPAKSTLSADKKTITTYAGTTEGKNTVYVKSQATAAAAFKPVNVDTETFKPLTTGLYLFARNVGMTDKTAAVTDGESPTAAAGIKSDYEFSGYYYSDFDTVYTTSFAHTQKNSADSIEGETVTKGNFGDGTYYALRYEIDDSNRSDYTVSSETYTATAPASPTEEVAAKLDASSGELLLAQPTANLALFTAEQKVVKNDDLKWTYTPANASNSTGAKLTATYDNGTATGTSPEKDDIKIDVNLANIYQSGLSSDITKSGSDASGNILATGTVGETWQVIKTSTTVNETTTDSKFTFYYNNDIEEGDTSAKLVDSVTLDSSVTEKAFMAFDFDLNVFMDSIQVTFDDAGKETDKPVNPKWDATTAETNTYSANKATAATGTRDNGGQNEISTITWEAAATGG